MQATVAVCQNSKDERILDASAWFFWVSFAAQHAEPAGISWKLRWNYVTMKLEACRTVSVKHIGEIPAEIALINDLLEGSQTYA